ncbi:hypothetical protein C0J52_12038 [Blattella germanica]|nr:hypothetical protein C0J52_12038 [Blattella germanica]
MAEGGGQELVCSLYISPSGSAADESQRSAVTRSILEQVVCNLKPTGPWQITETGCGLIAAFSSDNDAERLLCLDLAEALGGPVQAVLLRDVPWAIPLQDISGALAKQGIAVGGVERVRQHIKVEVLDANQYESLLRQGLDFFGAARFTAIPERWSRGVNSNGTSGNVGPNCSSQGEPMRQDSVLQCYRCQGFWHVAANCRHLPRCVRCGEPHSVEFCPRPRHDPVCCHCAGPHHAAYRQCPIRLQLLNATPVSITLSNSRQAKQLWAGSR